MTNEKKSQLTRSAGIALMAGAALAVFFMLHHPETSSGELGAALAEIRDEGAVSAWVHGMLMVVMIGILYGGYGLSRQLGTGRALPALGFMLFSFGTLAYCLAATVSGFIVPQVGATFADASPVQMEQARALLRLAGITNQAFANAGLIGTSAGILCWSVALLTRGRIARWVGIAGLAVSLLPGVLLLTGYLHLHVAGMTMVVVADSSWYFLAGLLLVRGLPANGGS